MLVWICGVKKLQYVIICLHLGEPWCFMVMFFLGCNNALFFCPNTHGQLLYILIGHGAMEPVLLGLVAMPRGIEAKGDKVEFASEVVLVCFEPPGASFTKEKHGRGYGPYRLGYGWIWDAGFYRMRFSVQLDLWRSPRCFGDANPGIAR